jgi:hypothetical protein
VSELAARDVVDRPDLSQWVVMLRRPWSVRRCSSMSRLIAGVGCHDVVVTDTAADVASWDRLGAAAATVAGVAGSVANGMLVGFTRSSHGRAEATRGGRRTTSPGRWPPRP